MDRIAQVTLNTMRQVGQTQRLVAANLANQNTIGFRRDLNFNIGSLYLEGRGQAEDRVFSLTQKGGIDTTGGSLIPTERPLDVAISGDGFLVGQTSTGEKILTRRGDLTPDNNGVLRNGDGNAITSGGAPIILPPYDKIEIAKDGTISYRPVGGEGNLMVPAGRLDLVNVPNANISKGLDSFLRPEDGVIPANDAKINLSSGFIESSNVNSVESMVEMIQLQRSYELQVKMLGVAKEIDTETSKLMRSSS